MAADHEEHCRAWRFVFESDSCPVLVVGEDNPQSSAPEHALYPHPVHCAGWNYAENIANVGASHHRATWRANLCNPTWSAKQARLRARELVKSPGAPWRVLVLLGRKVAGAFEAEFAGDQPIKLPPFSTGRLVHRVVDEGVDWMTIVSLPHPSGRCREWNNPANIHRARALLAAAAPGWYGGCNT